MATRNCPKCGLVSSASARNCDCGYNFETCIQDIPIGHRAIEPSYRKSPGSNFEPAFQYESYFQVPLYRKRWFLVLSLIFFTPLALVIAGSGDIYLEKSGVVFKYSEKLKRSVITVCIIFIVIALFKILTFYNRPFH